MLVAFTNAAGISVVEQALLSHGLTSLRTNGRTLVSSTAVPVLLRTVAAAAALALSALPMNAFISPPPRRFVTGLAAAVVDVLELVSNDMASSSTTAVAAGKHLPLLLLLAQNGLVGINVLSFVSIGCCCGCSELLSALGTDGVGGADCD